VVIGRQGRGALFEDTPDLRVPLGRPQDRTVSWWWHLSRLHNQIGSCEFAKKGVIFVPESK